MRIRQDSTDYVVVPITAAPAGVDLTDDTFDIAFTTTRVGAVAEPDWLSATYSASVAYINPAGKRVTGPAVRYLIGPEAETQLAPGVWHAQVRIHDTPEVPVLYGGRVTVLEYTDG